MSEQRILKINNLLQREIGKILQHELEFDNSLVTVSEVITSPTLEHTTVLISVIPVGEAKNVLQKIKKEIYDIQQILNKRLVMRPIPKIRFEIDHSEEKAGRIEEILQKEGEK
jgi:ribosome-binding factor A